MEISLSSSASTGKAPRTARGEKTLARILDAARLEFGEKGFAESSIVSITGRATVALGTFYTYFDSKEDLFTALVRDMSNRVREAVAPVLQDAEDALDGERRALAEYLRFVKSHREVYRIIDEAQFVNPEAFRTHYVTTAERISSRLLSGAERAEVSESGEFGREVAAWAVMGMNVFLGIRFGVWGDENVEVVAAEASRLLRNGLSAT